MATQAVLKTLTPASASPNKQKRRFNKMMPNTFKRILCAVMALVLMVALLPAVAVTAEAAGTAESVVFFSDLHSSASNAKLKLVEDTFSAVANSVSAPVSAVFSVGDAFSSNYSQDIADLSDLTTSIRKGLGNTSAHVDYAWSDHDRYGGINNVTGLVYGAGNDNVYGNSDDGNYYVYFISMSDMTSDPRYGTSSTFSNATLQKFVTDTAQLDKSKPLFIASHMPLLENRGDNGNAYGWYQAINVVAAKMDVIFLHGHNHYYDKAGEYYFAKGSSMNVAGDNSSDKLPLNFTHITAGYLDPATTNYAGNSRQKTVIVATITDGSIQLTTYCATGEYTGSYAVDVSVDRDHAHTHNYTVESFAPSCTENGGTFYTCVSCGHRYIDGLIEAPGHNFVPEVIAPTCTDAGYTLYTCEVCGDWYQDEEVDALGHNYTAVVTPPTADTQGYTTYTCKHCYDQYVDDFVDALGHKYEAFVTAPTCTTIGYTTYICKDCGDRYNDDHVEALGHRYTDTVITPTCNASGYTLHTCTGCGRTYKDNYISSSGHNNTVVVTAPTCTEMGYTTYTCTVCHEVTVGNYVKAADHNYNCVQSGNQYIYTCKICNYSYSETVEPEFIYSKSSSLANNKNYVIVLYYNKQYYALAHENNRISAVPVTVTNNRVVSDVTEDLLWNHNNKKLSYQKNGITYFLNATSTKLSINVSSSANAVYSGTKMKVGSNYLRYASNTISLNKTATTCYLFAQTNG